jgi:hypothetical protein
LIFDFTSINIALNVDLICSSCHSGQRFSLLCYLCASAQQFPRTLILVFLVAAADWLAAAGVIDGIVCCRWCSQLVR